MATRPLDAAFGGSTTKKSKKRGAILAVGIVAGLASIGSIFAASVSINSGQVISFTQGTTTIAACDTDGIQAEFSAIFSGTSFKLDEIKLTDVAAGCDGKVLTLNLYDGTENLVTVTGIIETTTVDEVWIGYPGEALTSENVAGGNSDYTLKDNVAENALDLVYEDGIDAVELAADADRIVIEIN
jgi:hypothetical protein